MIGNQIGDFRIIEKLGEGGMGVVYKAMDTRLDRPVAIKLLAANLNDNPELVARFQSEAKAQASLNHTNLATLYAFLVDQGNAYMVMEFIEGENFDQIIRRGGPMNPKDAVPWFKQALLGIGAAHRVGIIHRDIKPSNLMLNRQGIVKVMDFGIAKAIGSRGTTRTGVHLGTLAYMSPEQIQNRNVDGRSDIYALGVTLFEMLSGHVPFESESDFQIMHDHVSTPPPPLTKVYPYAPREFEGVIAKALAKSPDDRYQTVEEFGAALEHPEAVVVGAAPLAVAPSKLGRTVIESVTGAGQWQGAGAPAVAPPAMPGPAGPGAPTVVGSPTGLRPAAVGLGGGPIPPKKIPPMAIIVGGVVAALIAALGIFMWIEHNQPHPGGGGGASNGSNGPSVAESNQPSGGSSQEIVIAPGGTPAAPSSNQPSGGGGTGPGNAPSHRTTQPPPRSQQPQQQPAQQPQTEPMQPATQPRPHPVPQTQQPAQASPMSFIVKHRHIVRSGLRTEVYHCAGALLLRSDGTLSYNCAGTNDPSKRCEQVTFPRGSIRQLKLHGGELHMATTSLGNWDFYDYTVAGAVSRAYEAILPFVQ